MSQTGHFEGTSQRDILRARAPLRGDVPMSRRDKQPGQIERDKGHASMSRDIVGVAPLAGRDRTGRVVTKPDSRVKRADGVRSLDDIRDRCRVDDVTGCWHWAMSMSDGGKPGSSRVPRLAVPAGVMGDRSISTTAGRAALVLSGRLLPAGHVVWRTCCVDDCCAPDHLKAGTKAQEGAWMTRNGHRKGDPRRQATNTANAARSQAIAASVVRSIEADLAGGGQLQRDVAAAHGVHVTTISKIANGKHLHQRAGVRGSSVFAWRPA